MSEAQPTHTKRMGTSSHLDDLKAPARDITMEETESRSGASSPSRSDSTSCSTPGSLTGCDPLDKREEAKQRRAAEKRQKEKEKRLKEQAKKDAKLAEHNAKLELERQERLKKKEARDDDVIFVPLVTMVAPEDVVRQEAKAARQAAMQEVWSYQDEPLTKNELRAYYKDMKSKPKGKTPTKEARQFADL